MAVRFKTLTPKKLLAAYKKAVDEGHIKTWSCDVDGDFTHTADQWVRKAWFRPQIIEGKELVFNIVSPVETKMESATYAVYHGRLIESMLRHCDELFEEGSASALPDAEDTTDENV